MSEIPLVPVSTWALNYIALLLESNAKLDTVELLEIPTLKFPSFVGTKNSSGVITRKLVEEPSFAATLKISHTRYN